MIHVCKKITSLRSNTKTSPYILPKLSKDTLLTLAAAASILVLVLVTTVTIIEKRSLS